MKELIDKINKLTEEEHQNLVLIAVYKLWKPQIFEFLEKKQAMRWEILDSKIRKKRILGKTAKDVIIAELEDLEETICEDNAIQLLNLLESNFENVFDFIQTFDLYYRTFTYEFEDFEDEMNKYQENISNSNFMRGFRGESLINEPQRFLGRHLIGHNSQPKEFLEQFDKDFGNYLLSTLPQLPSNMEDKMVKTLAELWYDNQYFDLLSEKLKNLKNNEKNEMAATPNENLEEDYNGKKLSMPQKTLIMHFLFSRHSIPERKDKAKAEMIKDLCEIRSFKNLYDAVRNPFITEDKNFRRDDLKVILPYFEELGSWLKLFEFL